MDRHETQGSDFSQNSLPYSLPTCCHQVKMSRTIFVGNIPYKMTWKELKEFFSQFGPVKYAKCVIDFVTKKRRGFGFVEFESEEFAYQAYVAKDSQLCCHGRTLRVNFVDHHAPKQRPMTKSSPSAWLSDDSTCNALEEVTDGVSLDSITDDDLIHVLLFLDPVNRIRLERVSKRWRHCSLLAFKQQQHMTIRKTFKAFNAFTERMLYHVLSRCSSRLSSLDVSLVSSRFGNKALEVIASCCPGLEHLNMQGVNANNRAMEKFTTICRQLKTLKAVRCSKLSEKGFWYLFHNCQHLQELDCSGNTRITGKFFKYATSCFQRLNTANCSELSNAAVKALEERCPHLTELNLNNCSQVNGYHLENLLQTHDKLTLLNIGGIITTNVRRTNNPAIRKLANPSLMLTSLVLDNSDLMDGDVQFVCSACPNLLELDISCNHLSNFSMEFLCELKRLQVLHLCHLYCITSLSFMEIARSCTNLRVLRLQGCKLIEDEALVAVAQNCFCLEELDIAGVSLASDRTIAAFVEALRSKPERKLMLYVWGNDIYETLPLTRYPNLTVVSNYRPLYRSHNAWLCQGDDHPYIIQIPWNLDADELELAQDDSSLLDGFAGDGYDDEIDFDEDIFLVNDDPLEGELFEMA